MQVDFESHRAGLNGLRNSTISGQSCLSIRATDGKLRPPKTSIEEAKQQICYLSGIKSGHFFFLISFSV